MHVEKGTKGRRGTAKVSRIPLARVFALYLIETDLCWRFGRIQDHNVIENIKDHPEVFPALP